MAAKWAALAIGFALTAPCIAQADRLRVAFFHTELSRDGPGLLLRDILRDDDQVLAVRKVIMAASPDVLVLAGIDHDGQAIALSELNAGLVSPYPHLIGLPGNTGLDTGRDVDGNGRLGGARDMQAYGRFSGQGALAILSRLPIDRANVQSLNDMLWRDAPGSLANSADPAIDVQRLSAGGHWNVPLKLPSGQSLTIMAFHASTPVFDGPEDRNGRRNHDEITLWRHLLDGALTVAAPSGPFVIAGDANSDPVDGDSRHQAIISLLSDPRVTDPQPVSNGAAEAPDTGHMGPPALDTVDWKDPVPGNLRVDYVLPSRDVRILGSGVIWPQGNAPLYDTITRASRHRLVWVDIDIGP